MRLYLQILSILTLSFHKALVCRPTFDLRTLLSPVDVKCLRTLAARQRRDLALYLRGIEPLRLSLTHRYLASCALRGLAAPEPVILGLLLAGSRVVALSLSKYLALDSIASDDLSCLITFVMTSKSLREVESWIPVCLPFYNSGSFLTMYVKYIEDPVAVVYVSATGSTQQFSAISDYFHNKCVPILKNSGCLAAIFDSLECCPYALPPTICKASNLVHVAYSVSKIQVMTDYARAATLNIQNSAQSFFSTTSSTASLLKRDSDDRSRSYSLSRSSRENGTHISHIPSKPLIDTSSLVTISEKQRVHPSLTHQTKLQQVFSSCLMDPSNSRIRDKNPKRLKRILHLYKTALSLGEECPASALPVQVLLYSQREKVFCVIGRSTRIFCCAPRWTELTTETLRPVFHYLREGEASLFFSVSYLTNFS